MSFFIAFVLVATLLAVLSLGFNINPLSSLFHTFLRYGEKRRVRQAARALAAAVTAVTDNPSEANKAKYERAKFDLEAAHFLRDVQS